MPVRYYICPIVGTGTSTDSYRAKAADYPHIETSAAINIGVRSWCLVRVKANDFTAINADAECVDVLESLSDVSGANTRQEIAAWLKSHTVGDVPAAARTRVQNRLTAIGVSTAGITLQTTLWDVLLRVYRTIEPVNRMEDM
jgi:hypothetical protein